jgi:hypothetical protein
MEHSSQVEKVQKLFSLSIHDDNAGNVKDEVIFNPERFPELKVRAGDLVQISAVLENTTSRPSDKKSAANNHDASAVRSPQTITSLVGESKTERGIPVKTYDENGALMSGNKKPDPNRSYVFLVHDLTPEQKSKHPNIDLSVSQPISQIFGFRKWMPVLVTVIHEDGNAASHVEITFRDQYLNRADMWRLAISELSQRTVYRDQKLLFLDTIKATVKNVYVDGEKQKWGYFGRNTKPVFRSESARYVVFIQMSKEMWEFDVEGGGGEIMFNKVVNGFLPELFKSWMNIQAHHLVTIVLFSKVEYENFDTQESKKAEVDNSLGAGLGHRDFYRVVVNDWSSNDWIKILNQLKKEFRIFLRDITVQRSVEEPQKTPNSATDAVPEYKIIGKPSIAAKGNILEAISLASTQFSQDYIDRDLVRTGISIVVVTAGTGIYEVDYNLLKHSTDTLISSGIGIDLVCLSPMPLHSVPLFKYRNPRLVDSDGTLQVHNLSLDNTPKQSDISSLMTSRSGYPLSRQTSRTSDSELAPGEWSYAIPHWIDVSFWKGTVEEQSILTLSRNYRPNRRKDGFARDKPFALRCVLYELEMMGFMENELMNVGIQHVHLHAMHPWSKLRHRISGRPVGEIDWGELANLDRDWMENYDEHIFKPLHSRIAAEQSARKQVITASGNRPRSVRGVHALMEPSTEVTRTVNTGQKGAVGFLDWKISQGQSHRVDMPKRKSSILSFASYDKESIRSTTSGFSRATTTVAPKEDFSHGEDGIKPAILVSGSATVDKTGGWAGSSLLEQFRSALSRPTAPKDMPKTVTLLSSKLATPTKSDGKAKPIDIAKKRKLASHSRSSSDDQIGSVETVKANPTYGQQTSVTKAIQPEDSGAILNAASNTRRSGPKLSSSGEVPRIPTTLSPVSALAPWLILVNPSNPRKNDFNVNNQFRRWQHVFPKQLKTSAIKWKSLSSPASVPLTNDFFPSATQLENEYHQSPYKITQNTDDEMQEAPRSREALIRELMAFRLAHGFQLVVGPSVVDYLGRGTEEVNIFEKDYMTKDGDTVFMTVGNIIHQISCVSSGGVEIKRYTRKPSAEVEPSYGNNSLEYHPYIRTALSPSYTPRNISLKKPQVEYNWNFVDSFIAGHNDEFSEQLRFWRSRFVFIPVEIPFYNRRNLQTVTEDTEEEIRLEGIRKLTHIWNRNRVFSPEERGYQSLRRRKDHNPLMIDYQTRDPSAVIAAGPEGSLIAETDPFAQKPAIFSETEQYSTAHFDLQKLAQELQGEKGIRMIDRRWHLRLYPNCFIGFDLVSWLLERFRDIDTRDEAVIFGKELMEKGLFQHVRKEHKFRDGNFFYQITTDYRSPRPGSSWFGTRQRGSVPSTPMSDLSKITYAPDSARPKTSSSSDDDDEKSVMKPEIIQRKYGLSHVMRYNVDTRKHSYRPEIINLHYDRLHSPDNCYHFRIDWMNVTTKFIEDAVYDWAVHGKKYGLKLVQIPIAEAGSITESRPFREPYTIKLAVPPPLLNAPSDIFDSTSLTPQGAKDRFAVHKAILKKLSFVLDVESADSFPADVEVVYSWGQNDYKYTQYVHRSGTMLAQITFDGDFTLLPNRLYNDRLSAFKLERLDPPAIHDRRGANVRHPATAAAAGTLSSPTASPIVRPVPDNAPTEGNNNSSSTGGGVTRSKTLTAEAIKAEVEDFCHNERALQAFYSELLASITSARPRASPSPSPQLSLDVITQDVVPVPSLRLPPRGGLQWPAGGGIVHVDARQ